MKTSLIALSLFAIATAAALSSCKSSVSLSTNAVPGGVGVWDGRDGNENIVMRSNGTTSAARILATTDELHIMWRCYEVPPEATPLPPIHDLIIRAIDVLSRPDWTSQSDIDFWNEVKKLKPKGLPTDILPDVVDSIQRHEAVWTIRAYRDTDLESKYVYVALEITGPNPHVQKSK